MSGAIQSIGIENAHSSPEPEEFPVPFVAAAAPNSCAFLSFNTFVCKANLRSGQKSVRLPETDSITGTYTARL